MALLRECLRGVRTLHGENMPPPLCMRSTVSEPGFNSGRIMQTRTPLPGTPQPMHVWKGYRGVALAGDSWGDPKGPLVLLLHGLGQTRHAWRFTGQLLGKAGYHAVAFDARGHGDSDWAPDGDYTRESMVCDLCCLVQALGGKRPILLGASMGGATSLVAVGERYIDASALILVDIVPTTESEGVARIKSFMKQNAEGFVSLEHVAETVNRYRPPTRGSGNLAGLAKNVRLGADGKYHWHWDPLLMARLPVPKDRLVESARRLSLPTLLVRGGHSDVVSEQGVSDFLALCPHSEYINVAGAGHMVAGDRNDTFGEAALDFLQRKVPAAAY
ncbi:alpha/beta hydrolase [Polaromonas hydrogenivorans]|uniref:Alpha/beta hydrolase n=1 Tax=Polaromonas hydrogenivorans TaxID=335476 RepID=A0AAU7LYW5_9BURK